MHRLLKRQLKKAGLSHLDTDDVRIRSLIDSVNQAYQDTDADRVILENTLRISSREMQGLYDNLKHASERDGLTGLPNRQHLEQELIPVKIEQNALVRKNFSLCLIDIDHFKQINDSLGHDIGNRLLAKIASGLKSLLGKDDLLARIGGDEFVVVFNGVDGDEIGQRAQSVMQLLQQTWIIDEHELILSASMGISVYPDNGHDVGTLMKKADLAMYKAKSCGRNIYRQYQREMENEIIEDLALIQRMPKALENGEFVLYFQPSINTNSNRISGAEALIRWNHPEKGLIYPDKFIYSAESTGFIVKLGRWVIEESCMAIARFNQKYPKLPLCVSVNVSIRQFQRGDIFQVIRNAIQTSGIDPAQLAVEITESVMGDNTSIIVNKLEKIKSLGVKIYLDDFGTGYSSLAYINDLPIDVIKIDKVFVDEIFDNSEKKVLLDTIIAMGNVLNKHVIAEGVEKDCQIEHLLSRGCDSYQGHIYSKALPESDFNALLDGVSQDESNPENTTGN